MNAGPHPTLDATTLYWAAERVAEFRNRAEASGATLASPVVIALNAAMLDLWSAAWRVQHGATPSQPPLRPASTR